MAEGISSHRVLHDAQKKFRVELIAIQDAQKKIAADTASVLSVMERLAKDYENYIRLSGIVTTLEFLPERVTALRRHCDSAHPASHFQLGCGQVGIPEIVSKGAISEAADPTASTNVERTIPGNLQPDDDPMGTSPDSSSSIS